VSPEKKYVKAFDWQVRAIMDIWKARLVGKNKEGKVTLSLEFAGEEPIHTEYYIPQCKLEGGDFEIRVYRLEYRQPHGITVVDARKYMREYGGVHVYDGGFHLPFYGTKENDWLWIQLDHARRISKSELLPEELQVEWGMRFLPTLSRVFGVVNVDTSKELDLNILITRDRLQDTSAFRNLKYMVRYAMDFYATKEAERSFEREIVEIKPLKLKRLEEVLIKHKSEVSEKAYEDLREDMRGVADAIETEAEAPAKKIGLLGSLATAGISSVAYQHELRQQFQLVDSIVERIEKIKVEDEKLGKALNEVREDLTSWVERARATNAIFTYLADPENVEMRRRFYAKKVTEEIKEQVKILARGAPIEAGRMDEDLLLPKASLIEWSSIFQNVFINAFNAMIGSEKKLVDVSSRRKDDLREILVQDTGCGVDLADAETLFKPFKRRAKISPERRALGYGGTGLGLTIVKLIANNIGCDVSFVEPEKGFNTAFSITWREVE